MAGNEDTQIKPTHGMGSAHRRGREVLNVEEIQSLDTLKAMLRDPNTRREVREELTARTVVIIRRGFRYLEAHPDHYGTGDGPIKYVGVYMNLLARLLAKWPDPVSEARHVQEMERIDKVLEAADE